MKEKEVIERVLAHNKMIDDYINNDLVKALNAKNGKITMNDWFKANALIKEQNFYQKGKAILDELRSEGFDVKMDMQSDKLVYKCHK